MHRRWWIAALLLFAVAAHWPALGNGYAMDDPWVAARIHPSGQPNPLMTGQLPLSAAFTRHYWWKTRERSPLYRPLTILSFAVLERWFASGRGHARAFPQHLANLALHLLAVALVLVLMGRLGLPPPAAFAAAAWFAVLPAHSEVVAGVVGRGDLLAFDFGLGGLLLLLRGFEAGGPAALARSIGAIVLFTGAALSKETGLVWAFLPLPLHLGLARGRGVPAGRAIARRAVQAAAAAAVPAALLFWLRSRAEGVELGAPILYLANPLAHSDTWTRIRTVFAVWLHALALTFGGTDLSSDYGAHVIAFARSFLDPRFLCGALLLAAAAVFSLVSFRRRPWFFAAGLFFFSFALPVSNLFFPIGAVFGERFLYPASLGSALVAGWLLAGPVRRRRLWLLVALACLHGAVASYQRCLVWKDDTTLFVHDAERVPRSARLQLAAARIEDLRGHDERERSFLERALAAWPEYPAALNGLGVWFMEHGDWARGEELLRKGLASPWLGPKDEFGLRFNLAQALLHRLDGRAAYGELARCLALDPALLARRLDVFEERLGALPRREAAFVRDVIRRVRALAARRRR